MRHWYVVTPAFDVVIPVLDDGTGPVETGSDVIEVEAVSARDAIALGVKAMLSGARYPDGQRYRWVFDQRSDGCCPYAGVKAIPAAKVK